MEPFGGLLDVFLDAVAVFIAEADVTGSFHMALLVRDEKVVEGGFVVAGFVGIDAAVEKAACEHAAVHVGEAGRGGRGCRSEGGEIPGKFILRLTGERGRRDEFFIVCKIVSSRNRRVSACRKKGSDSHVLLL